MGWLMQMLCDHEPRYLTIKTLTYNTEYVTNKAEDHTIFCRMCGKTIVPTNQFDALKELLTGKKGLVD